MIKKGKIPSPGTPGSAVTEVEAVVEIPRGSRNKYEYDLSTNTIRLDRVLFSSIHYPTDYGFIPGTKTPDGDPLDVLIIVEEPTFPGCHVKARVIGVLHMEDEAGIDDKILAVTAADPRFAGINDISNLQPHWLSEIENFFKIYKLLEKKKTFVLGWNARENGIAIIENCKSACSGDPAHKRVRGRLPKSGHTPGK